MNRQDECIVTTIWLIVNNIVTQGLRGPELQYYGRCVGTLLFDHSTSYSGYTSAAALLLKYRYGTNWCKEHIWPRQLVGERLIADFIQLGTVSKKLLIEKIKAYTVVHRVTAKENKMLKQFQKRETFISPEHSYKRANISRLLVWKSSTRIQRLPTVYPDLIPTHKRRKKP